MDQSQNQAPNQFQAAEAPKKSFGPLIGIIVIILLLVIGAFYVWGGKLSEEEALPEAQEVSAIESDLAETDLEIDLSGLDTIE